MSLQNNSDTALSISELNGMIKELLESSLPPIWVEGEISNFARPASGHMYFSLKDDSCQVRSVMFRNRNMLLDFKPENGSQVVARVKIGFYEARGEFQLIVERMEQAGDGQLLKQFEALKRKLASEGLFDEHIKKELPELPERIGIITSPTGAAIRDVLSVLRRRFPSIPVAIYPVPVQGEAAAPAIARTLQMASQHGYCDVLLLVRGGGSLEDLWAFNEEIVARAIGACDIPVISGVGHETDITIADFAADVRAPTPSAAAELVTPDQLSYQQTFDYYNEHLTRLIQQKLRHHAQHLSGLQIRLKNRHPSSQLIQFEKQRESLTQRLLLQWQHNLSRQKSRYDYLLGRLLQLSPQRQLAVYSTELEALLKRLLHNTRGHQYQQGIRLSSLARTLNAISPLQTLSRGYAIASKAGSDQNITSFQQVQKGDQLWIRLHQGILETEVINRLSDKK